MPVLEITRRKLNEGVEPNDSHLISILPRVRESTGAKYVFYSAMEEPEAFFQIGEWESLDAWRQFESTNDKKQVLQFLNQFSTVEWTEHMPIDSINTLPVQAPVMTVSRCLFKEYDDHPRTYEKEVATLLPEIEAETKPWRYVGGWTVDTRPDLHKWIVFGGYRSKKHHQLLATRLKDECEFFAGMSEHYDEGTVHRHCWNMETVPQIEMFETMQGFIPQKITKART